MQVYGIEANRALIVEAQTGIAYSAQVGGVACLHPEVEGFLLLPWWLDRFADLDTCSIGCCGSRFIEPDGDVLEGAWPTWPNGHFHPAWFIRLDRERLGEGTEAWVPVICYALDGYDPDGEGAALDGRTAWLVLENCD